MIDEKKVKKVIDPRRAATAADMSKIWSPLKTAVLAQGAAELRDGCGDGFVRPSFGWRSPDPSALGAILEDALLAQLSGLLPKFGAKPFSKGEKGWKQRSEQISEDRRALALASWGLDLVSDGWGYAQSLAALSRACRELPLIADPAPLLETMLRGAVTGPYRSTLDDASARLIALAGAGDIWSDKSGWGGAFAKKADAFSDPLARRLDIGHWGAAMIKAGSERHDSAEAVVFLLSKYAKIGAEDDMDWFIVGGQVGSQLGTKFVRAEKLPEVFFEKIPMHFWLGAKSDMGPASKVGAVIYQRLLARAGVDAKIKSRLCASAWMGLDRKEIDAFESMYPGESGVLLKTAVAEELADASGFVSAIYRLATNLGRPSGAWAKKAFAAQDLRSETLVEKVWSSPGGAANLVDAMGSAYATREALLIKEEVGRAAKRKALDEGKKSAPSVKRAKPKRI